MIERSAKFPLAAGTIERNGVNNLQTRLSALGVGNEWSTESCHAGNLYARSGSISSANQNLASAHLATQIVNRTGRQNRYQGRSALIVFGVSTTARTWITQHIGIEGLSAIAGVGERKPKIECLVVVGNVGDLGRGFSFVRSDSKAAVGQFAHAQPRSKSGSQQSVDPRPTRPIDLCFILSGQVFLLGSRIEEEPIALDWSPQSKTGLHPAITKPAGRWRIRIRLARVEELVLKESECVAMVFILA